MKNLFLSPARRGALCALGLFGLSAGVALLPALTPPAQAAPKRLLELWPGQRVLLVLPFTIGPDWNGGPELAEAIKPLIRPTLQNALTDTDKFSITLPYRFDPILRRAVVENRISQDIITPFVDTPSLETAQPVFNQLKFEQVPMVTQVQIEEVRVGGTKKKPTAQLQVSAKLYEVGNPNPFRSVVITSNPVGGRTPEDRLQGAAADAFGQVAAFFVKAPDSFQLPENLDIAADKEMDMDEEGMDKEGTMDGKKPVTPVKPVAPDPVVPAPKPMVPATPPKAMAPGTSVIPMIPAGQPPLGIVGGGEKALGR